MTQNRIESMQYAPRMKDQIINTSTDFNAQSSLATDQLQAQAGRMNPLPPIFGYHVEMVQGRQNSK